jgi:hypothetical protein
MNRNKIIILIILAQSLFLSSCEKDAKNVKIPDFKPKLVISSFISPSDKISYITISSTQRNFGDLSQAEPTGNLTGFLSDGTSEITLDTTNSGLRFSQNEMLIKEGKTYNLRVLSDRGLTAEASCTVPAERDFNIEMDTLRQLKTDPGGMLYSNLSAEITITDFPGENNYYRLFCTVQIFGSPYWDPDIPMRLTDYEKNDFTDNGRDGQRFLLKSLDLPQFPNVDSSILRIYLYNTDKAYYDFQKSFDNYSGGEDPFTEAAPLFTNITGGLGIFAAYTTDSLIFRLK